MTFIPNPGRRAFAWRRFPFYMLKASAPLIFYSSSIPAGSLLMSLCAARIMEQSEFGGFAVIWATVQTFSAVGQGSLAFAATRFVSQLAVSDAPKAVALLRDCGRWSIISGAMISMCLAAGAYPIASWILGQPELATAMRFAALLNFCLVCSSVLASGLLGAPLKSSGYTLGLIQVLGPVAGATIGATLGGLVGAVIGLSTAYLIRWLWALLLFKYWQQRSGTQRSSDRSERKMLAHFAGPSVIAAVVTPTAQWLALSTLASSGMGLEAAALFAVASNVRNLAAFPASIMWQTFSVHINRALGENRMSDVMRLTLVNLILSGCSVAAIAIALSFFRETLLGTFGSAYVQAQSILVILLLASLVDACSSAIYQLVVAFGAMWKSLFWIVAPRDGLLVTLAIILTPTYSAEGLAAAHAAAACTGLIATLLVAVSGWRHANRAIAP